jgi:hypothetical protein
LASDVQAISEQDYTQLRRLAHVLLPSPQRHRVANRRLSPKGARLSLARAILRCTAMCWPASDYKEYATGAHTRRWLVQAKSLQESEEGEDEALFRHLNYCQVSVTGTTLKSEEMQ